LTKEDPPDDLNDAWLKLDPAASGHTIDPRNAGITRIEDQTAACAMSLSRKEARDVLAAYASLVSEVTRRIGAIRKNST